MKKGGKIKRERETERERDRLFFQTPNFYVFFKKMSFLFGSWTVARRVAP